MTKLSNGTGGRNGLNDMPVGSTNYLKGRDSLHQSQTFRHFTTIRKLHVSVSKCKRDIGKHSAHSHPGFCGSCASTIQWPCPAQRNIRKSTVHQALWRIANEWSDTTKGQSLSLMSAHIFHQPVSQHWLKNRTMGWGSLLQVHSNWHVRAKQTFEGKIWLLNYRPVREREINRWEKLSFIE